MMLTYEQFRGILTSRMKECDERMTLAESKDPEFLSVIKGGAEGVLQLRRLYDGYVSNIALGMSSDEALACADRYARWFVDGMGKLAGDMNLNEFVAVKNRIYPIIKPRTEADNHPDALTKPYEADLSIFYGVEGPQAIILLDRSMPELWGVKRDEIEDIGYENFLRDKDLPLISVNADVGLIFTYNYQDSFDATRFMMLHRFRDKANKIKGELLCMVPMRDFVVAFSARPRSSARKIVERAKHLFKLDPYGISDTVFELHKTGWLKYWP